MPDYSGGYMPSQSQALSSQPQMNILDLMIQAVQQAQTPYTPQPGFGQPSFMPTVAPPQASPMTVGGQGYGVRGPSFPAAGVSHGGRPQVRTPSDLFSRYGQQTSPFPSQAAPFVAQGPWPGEGAFANPSVGPTQNEPSMYERLFGEPPPQAPTPIRIVYPHRTTQYGIRSMLGLPDRQPATQAPAAAPSPSMPQIFERHNTTMHAPINPATMQVGPGGYAYVPSQSPPATQAAAAQQPNHAAGYAQFVAGITGDPVAAAYNRAPARVNPAILGAYTAAQGQDVNRMEAQARMRELEYRMGPGQALQMMGQLASSPLGATMMPEQLAERARSLVGAATAPQGQAPAAGSNVRTLLSSLLMRPGESGPVRRNPSELLTAAMSAEQPIDLNRDIADVLQFMNESYGGTGSGSFRDWYTTPTSYWGRETPEEDLRRRIAEAINARLPGATSYGGGWSPRPGQGIFGGQWARPLPPDIVQRLRAAGTPMGAR